MDCEGCPKTLIGRQRRWCSKACRQRVRRREQPGSGQGSNRAYWQRQLAKALQVERERVDVHRAAVRANPPETYEATREQAPLLQRRLSAKDRVTYVRAKLAEIDPLPGRPMPADPSWRLGAAMGKVRTAEVAIERAQEELDVARHNAKDVTKKRHKLERAQANLERAECHLVKARRLWELANRSDGGSRVE